MNRRTLLQIIGGSAVALTLPRFGFAATQRILTLGGAVTETAYALGAEADIVGVDATSLFPDATTKLPNVGYYRALSAEGILALAPTLVITTEDAGPPAALEQVRAAGVKVVALPEAHDAAAASARIRKIGEALGKDGSTLAAALDTQFAALAVKVKARTKAPRVLFVYARGGGTLNVGGTGTAADAMIRLAGGVNVATFEGYLPLTAESAIGAAPDVVLVTTRGLESLGGAEALWASPGLALTPAGKTKKLIALDDLYLLGFGPRSADAATELFTALEKA